MVRVRGRMMRMGRTGRTGRKRGGTERGRMVGGVKRGRGRGRGRLKQFAARRSSWRVERARGRRRVKAAGARRGRAGKL